jgi:hypothetical protein
LTPWGRGSPPKDHSVVLRLTGRRIAPPRRPRAQECEALLGPPPEESRRLSSGQGPLRGPPPSPRRCAGGKGHGPGCAARSRAPHREGVVDPLPAKEHAVFLHLSPAVSRRGKAKGPGVRSAPGPSTGRGSTTPFRLYFFWWHPPLWGGRPKNKRCPPGRQRRPGGPY